MPRGSRNAPLHTPEHDRCFPDMLWSPITISDRGQPSDPGTSLRVPPGCAGDMIRRLVAQSISADCGPASGPPPAMPRRSVAADAVRPSRRAPTHGVPVDRSVLGSVHHRRSGLGIVRLRHGCGVQLVPRFWCRRSSVFAGSPDPRQHPLGSSKRSYPASYTRTTDGGASIIRSRFPAAFRPPAFASRVVLRPPRNSAFLTVGLPDAHARLDHDGVVTFHMSKIRPGWVSSVPRGRWCAPGLASPRAAPAASQWPAPTFPLLHPIGGSAMTRHQRGFMFFTRPVFPSL